jgi:hypothetical protein
MVILNRYEEKQMSNNANDEIMKLYEYLVKEQQLTPTAVQRALVLYQKVVQDHGQVQGWFG